MKPNFETLRDKKAKKRLAFTQLKASAKHAKHRFSPSNLANEATDKALEMGEVVAGEGIDFAKKHKWPLLGAGAIVGIFLAREPIAKFIEDLREKE